MIAAAHHEGLPSDEASLRRMGLVASAAGAACVEVLGALPVAESGSRMRGLAASSLTGDQWRLRESGGA